MAIPSCEPQRKFGNGLRVCVPGAVFDSLSQGRVALRILHWVRSEVPARCDQPSSMETDRRQPRGFASLSHGSVPPCHIHPLLGIEGRVVQFCLTISIDDAVSIDCGLMKDK